MSFKLSKDELKKLSNVLVTFDFYNAEMLISTFRTDFRIASEIVPGPLSPIKESLATVFVARYPETNFGSVYNEGALLIHCQYKGEKGMYCLSMPVDEDMALIGGREQFGAPKKIADKITLEKNGDSVRGIVIRKNVEIIRIESELGEKVEKDFAKHLGRPSVDWDQNPCINVLVFWYKFFSNPAGSGFDYLPRLVREPVLFRPKGDILKGTGKVKLNSNMGDPLGEVPVGEIVNMFYGVWDNSMIPGKVVARNWNPWKFARYAFSRTDHAPFLLSQYDPENVDRLKMIRKFVRRF